MDFFAMIRMHQAMEIFESRLERVEQSSKIDNENSRKMQKQLDDLSKSFQKALDQLLPKVDELLERTDRMSTPQTIPPASDKPCLSANDNLTKPATSSNANQKEKPTENAAKVAARAKIATEKLYHAVLFGDAVEVNRLLKEGGDASARYEKGHTLLQISASLGHEDKVIALLDAGADVNAYGGIQKATPLLLASIMGFLEIARRLLAAGACLTSRDFEGHTPLHRAAMKQNWDIVELLIRNGAHADPFNKQVLIIAASCGQAKVVKTILGNCKLPTEKKFLWKCMSCAGNVAVVHAFEDAFPGCVRSKVGENAMIHAASQGRRSSLAALLDAGVNINACNANGTALGYACFAGRLECAKLLISRGALLNIKDKNGFTPLHNAASRGNESCVRLLLNAGADRGIKNNKGQVADDVSKTEAVKQIFRFY